MRDDDFDDVDVVDVDGEDEDEDEHGDGGGGGVMMIRAIIWIGWSQDVNLFDQGIPRPD